MYKNNRKARWEASAPEHLIGWAITMATHETDGNFAKMILENTVTGEERVCWVDAEIMPSEVVQRNYRAKK